jgi:hypothetical protein
MALLTRTGAAALALFAVGPVAVAQVDRPVGQVAQAAPQVEGRHDGKVEALHGPDKKASQNASPVYEKMEITTSAGAGARILINTDLPKRKGVVILGPETRIQLTERSLTLARSLKTLNWLVKLGQFRLALRPRDPNDPPDVGECFIYTLAHDFVRLTGTDVAVEVAPDGTLTVWVIEGEVEVTAAAGGMKRIPAGYRTRVRPGHDPEPPVHFTEIDGPGPGLPLHHEERIFSDPPRLDLRTLRLDLPQ